MIPENTVNLQELSFENAKDYFAEWVKRHDSDLNRLYDSEMVETCLELLENKSIWNPLYNHIRETAKDTAGFTVDFVDEWRDHLLERHRQEEHEIEGEMNVHFDTGDAAEVSRYLEAALIDNTENLVFDRGELHRYNPETNLWEPIPESELSAILQEFSGAPVGRKSKLKMSGRLRNDAIGFLKDRYDRSAPTKDAPGFFDKGPTGLMFSNVFVRVDLENGTLIPEDGAREHRALNGVEFEYNPEAQAPRFEQYLDEIFEGDEDAETKKRLLLEFTGACVLGVAPSFEKALILYDATDRSGGANGKSVFIKLLNEALPGAATSEVKPQQFDEKFSDARLVDSRMNFATELPENDILASDTLKGVITGDPMQGERKYKDPFSFRPEAGHLFGANEFPRVVSTDDAFWRRWVVLPFFNRFTPPGEPGRDRVPNLEDKIIGDGELPGIFAKMVNAVRRLIERGKYTVPPSAERAKAEWRRQSNPVEQFLQDKAQNYTPDGLQTDHRHDHDWWRMEDCYEPARSLYRRFRSWAKRSGHSSVSETTFGRRAKKLLPRKKTAEGHRYRVKFQSGSDETTFCEFSP